MYLKQSYKRLDPSALVKGFHLKQLVNLFLVRGCAILFLALLGSLGGCSADRESSRDQEMLAKAREITGWFLSYELTRLANYLNHEEFPLDSLRHLRDWVSDRLGQESEVLREDLYAIGCQQEYYYYIRFSTFDKKKQHVRTSFQFSGDYQVRQLAIDTLGEPALTNFEFFSNSFGVLYPR